MNIILEIQKYKVVPVVVANTLEQGRNIIEGLVEGGLPIAEITFRTSCAAELIKESSIKYPTALIGAGTVINREQCIQAIEAGAKFIVSPGLSKDVADECKKQGIIYLPGVVTPTEVIEGISLGLEYLKFFPASNYGGVKTIKALCSAFPSVKFMPTGGIDENNILEYLSFEKIFACGGSFMVKGSKEDIIKKVKETLSIISKI